MERGWVHAAGVGETAWCAFTDLPGNGAYTLKSKGASVWAVNDNNTKTVWNLHHSSTDDAQHACTLQSVDVQDSLVDIAVDANDTLWLMTQDNKFFTRSRDGSWLAHNVPALNTSHAPYFQMNFSVFDVYNATNIYAFAHYGTTMWPWMWDGNEWGALVMNGSNTDARPVIAQDGGLAEVHVADAKSPYVRVPDVSYNIFPFAALTCRAASFANGTGCCLRNDTNAVMCYNGSSWNDVTSKLLPTNVTATNIAFAPKWLFVVGSDDVTRAASVAGWPDLLSEVSTTPPLSVASNSAAGLHNGTSVWASSINGSLHRLLQDETTHSWHWTTEAGPEGKKVVAISTNSLDLPWIIVSTGEIYGLQQHTNTSWKNVQIMFDVGMTEIAGDANGFLAVGTDGQLYRYNAPLTIWSQASFDVRDVLSIAVDTEISGDFYLGKAGYLAKASWAPYFQATNLACSAAAMLFQSYPSSGLCFNLSGVVEVFHKGQTFVPNITLPCQKPESLVLASDSVFVACGAQVFAASLTSTVYSNLSSVLRSNDSLPASMMMSANNNLPAGNDSSVTLQTPTPLPILVTPAPKSSSNVGAIVGIAVGIAVALALIAAVLACLCCRHISKKRLDDDMEHSFIAKAPLAGASSPHMQVYKKLPKQGSDALRASGFPCDSPHIFTYQPPPTIPPQFMDAAGFYLPDAAGDAVASNEAPSMTDSVLQSVMDVLKPSHYRSLPTKPHRSSQTAEQQQLQRSDDPRPPASEGLLELLQQCREQFITKALPPRPDVDLNIDPNVDVKVGQLLGAGAHGMVYEGWWTRRDGSKKHVAVKVMMPDELSNPVMRAVFQEELEIMTRLSHPHIVRCYGGCNRNDCCVLLLELLSGGSLDDYIHVTRKALPEGEVLLVGHQIASALAYLHPTVVHVDIKPQNILLDAKGSVKLADFGMSKLKQGRQTETRLGCTPPYTAPEVFDGTKCTEKVDVYSLAVVMWECLTGEHPFRDCKSFSEIVNKVRLLGERPAIPNTCSKEMREILEECWHTDPRVRPSAHELSRTTLLLAKQLYE